MYGARIDTTGLESVWTGLADATASVSRSSVRSRHRFVFLTGGLIERLHIIFSCHSFLFSAEYHDDDVFSLATNRAEYNNLQGMGRTIACKILP